MPTMTMLLTIPEVAERLRCSRRMVYELINAGEIRTVDISAPGSRQSKSRVREEDLQLYFDTITARSAPKG